MSNIREGNEHFHTPSGIPGRTALVTGASRGIGMAVAESLSADGWNLILTCSRTLPALRSFAADLEARHHTEVRSMLCDMGDAEQVRTLFRNIASLDLLVNNAGISHVGLLQDMTDEEWNRVIAVDLSSVFYTSRAAIPLFLKNRDIRSLQGGETKPAVASAQMYSAEQAAPSVQDDSAEQAAPLQNERQSGIVPGRIINISSVWGNVGASCEVAYSAAKGGVNAFTRALAKELAPSGIPVNSIACGCVDTVMNDHLSPDEKLALAQEIPFGRFAAPSEIARAVLQLVHAPAYLTGQIITVDGGWI